MTDIIMRPDYYQENKKYVRVRRFPIIQIIERLGQSDEIQAPI